MNEPTMQPNKTVSPRHGFSVHQIAAIGIMSAVTCILAPFSIPIGPVPISLTNLAIYFALYILGMKEGTIHVFSSGGSSEHAKEWREGNVNNLISPLRRDNISGFVVLKAVPCNVYKKINP